MKQIKGLSLEAERRYRGGIKLGLLDGYENDVRSFKHTFVGSFLWKYPGRTMTVNVLKDIVGHVPQWQDITDEVIRDFVDELAVSRSQSTVRTMCAELKAVLNENKHKIRSQSFSKTLSVKNETSQAVYLTDDEVKAFLAYVPQSSIERYVHRNFSVELLTGARLCDVQKLTMRNCDANTGMLSYVPDKTSGIVVTLPVDERRGLRNFLATETAESVHLTTYNDTVRRICRTLGFSEQRTIFKAGSMVTAEKWQLVSSHTARRSFATNLYLAGISIEDIAMMMGHGKNIETTKRYICADKTIAPNVLAYFNQQHTT